MFSNTPCKLTINVPYAFNCVYVPSTSKTCDNGGYVRKGFMGQTVQSALVKALGITLPYATIKEVDCFNTYITISGRYADLSSAYAYLSPMGFELTLNQIFDNGDIAIIQDEPENKPTTQKVKKSLLLWLADYVARNALSYEQDQIFKQFCSLYTGTKKGAYPFYSLSAKNALKLSVLMGVNVHYYDEQSNDILYYSIRTKGDSEAVRYGRPGFNRINGLG